MAHPVCHSRVLTRILKVENNHLPEKSKAKSLLYKLIETLQKVSQEQKVGVQNSKLGVNENSAFCLHLLDA